MVANSYCRESTEHLFFHSLSLQFPVIGHYSRVWLYGVKAGEKKQLINYSFAGDANDVKCNSSVGFVCIFISIA